MAPAAAAVAAAAQMIQRCIAFSLARQRVYLFGDAMRHVASWYISTTPFARNPSHEMRVRADAHCCSAGRAPGTRATLSVQADPPHRALCGWRHLRHPRQTDRAEAERGLGPADRKSTRLNSSH